MFSIAESLAATQVKLRSLIADNGMVDGLKKFDTDHGIHAKTDGSLIILDYNQIEVKWTEPYGWVCRGLVLDADTLEVVAFGLAKFFNYGEGYADSLDFTTARIMEKLDGSMVNRFFNKKTGQFETTTRYQLPRDAAINMCHSITWKDLIDQCLASVGSLLDEQPQNETWTFEVMCPFNRVVVRHQDFSAKLLAVRNNDTLEERIPHGPHVVRTFSFSSMEETAAFANTLKGVEQEGFVVCDAAFGRVKVKGEQYVQLHRLRDSTSSGKAIILLAKGGDYEEVLLHFPDLTKDINLAVDTINGIIDAHEKAYTETKDIASQKDFALAIKDRVEMPQLLFLTRSGKAASIRAAFLGLRETAFVDAIKAKLPATFGVL
jgi:hypothetical protein